MKSKLQAVFSIIALALSMTAFTTNLTAQTRGDCGCPGCGQCSGSCCGSGACNGADGCGQCL